MTTTMTERDETTGTSPHRYHHTRTVEISGRTVRAHFERDYYTNQSRRYRPLWAVLDRHRPRMQTYGYRRHQSDPLRGDG